MWVNPAMDNLETEKCWRCKIIRNQTQNRNNSEKVEETVSQVAAQASQRHATQI